MKRVAIILGCMLQCGCAYIPWQAALPGNAPAPVVARPDAATNAAPQPATVQVDRRPRYDARQMVVLGEKDWKHSDTACFVDGILVHGIVIPSGDAPAWPAVTRPARVRFERQGMTRELTPGGMLP